MANYITFVLMRGNKARTLVEVIIHALFWLGVYYALQALTVSSFKMVARYNDRPTMSMDAHTVFPYSHVVLGALMLLFYGNILGLFPRVIRLKSKGVGVAVITGWGLLLFVLNYGVIRQLIKPAGIMPGAHNAVLNIPEGSRPPAPTPFSVNDWMRMQGVMAAIFLSVLGIAVACFFIREWIRNDLRRSQAEAQQLSTELRFLRSQVNPHFLFNTLNNLFSMAQKKGADELADGISKLSGMMRYMIYESNTDTVPLQQEIEYLEDCIALSKLRYADSEVVVYFRHPALAAIAGVRVTPMLFIPFLENAFKHGVSIGHHSRIAMDLAVEQKKLTFTCENTDHSAVKKLEEEKGGIGLENVRRRLDLVYPGRHALRAGPEEGKYKVTLQIELA
jgi:two-component system LytT family sensor kinase